MKFWPQKLLFSDIIINSLWSLIAWIVWGIIIIIIIYFSGNVIDVSWNLGISNNWIQSGAIFPLLLSLITLVWSSISTYLTYRLLIVTSPEKYRKNIVISGQIAFFTLLTYFFITPIYIYVWLINFKFIMDIFIIHALIITFWTSILIEVLNNYRNILIWLYWSFVWLFLSMIIVGLIFYNCSEWTAKLISLILILPIVNFCTTLFKQLFEFIYYYYYKYTNLDQLWDIFYQIETEETELLNDEEEKNTI